MPRKGQVKLREISPDPKFHDRTVAKFINTVMERGKKSTAEEIFYGALDLVANRTKEEGLAVFKHALENVRPAVEVRSRRVGGANYQVPVEVPQRRARTLAVRWLVDYARQRREKGMVDKLSAEILDALNQQGGAFKKKDDVYRMAQANKAFAHYRW
jgi:small subunit ribosomal protein S7